MRIAITSMYANPLHPGHIECLELSKAMADELWVVINNDHQAKLKRGTESFQDEHYRCRVVAALKPVDRVVLATDTDGSVCQTLETLFTEARQNPAVTDIFFTKGGDRFASEIPERAVCEAFNVTIIDGLGAKTHSSSSYVSRVANQADEANLSAALAQLPDSIKEREYLEVGYRPWGVYYVLEDSKNYKVKKIIVQPGQRLSLQSHQHRSEHWVVVAGTATLQIRHSDDPAYIGHQILRPNQSCYIPQGHIHRLANQHDEILVLVEVQTGHYTGEDDIVRYEDDYDRSTPEPANTHQASEPVT